ncbi:bifunctional adenosylcobinamide kinase/adenosylcobinamide-phosphate guanylyltransferase [Paenibacillus marinisediminis]
MIIGVTGHVGSGKTSYILRYAASFGREGLVVTVGHALLPVDLPGNGSFRWKTVTSDIELPAVLERINRESNLFRADRRVVVIKSVADYLASCHRLIMQTEAGIEVYRERMSAYREQLENAAFSYQGMLFIVSNEPASLTPFMSDQERCFHEQLAAFNRHAAKHSHQWFWMSSGMAIELRSRSER